MDAIDGLKALEQVVETISEELHDLYQSRDIPQIERVTLQTLEWTLAKLADDLHTMRYEVRDLRMAEAAARRELAELTKKAERKPWMEWQPPANVDKLYKRIPGDGIMVHNLIGGDRDLPALYEAGWRYLPITPENELTKKAGELPAEHAPEPYQWQAGDQVVRDGLVREVQYVQPANGLLRICKEGLAQQCDHERAGWQLHRKASDKPAEPAPEPYQWQVGDNVINRGELRAVDVVSEGWIKLDGLFSCCRQTDWERADWKLHRKASDLGVQQLTPRQVEISDSTGTDGEGQP
jgi:hypothetical protein